MGRCIYCDSCTFSIYSFFIGRDSRDVVPVSFQTLSALCPCAIGKVCPSGDFLLRLVESGSLDFIKEILATIIKPMLASINYVVFVISSQ